MAFGRWRRIHIWCIPISYTMRYAPAEHTDVFPGAVATRASSVALRAPNPQVQGGIFPCKLSSLARRCALQRSFRVCLRQWGSQCGWAYAFGVGLRALSSTAFSFAELLRVAPLTCPSHRRWYRHAFLSLARCRWSRLWLVIVIGVGTATRLHRCLLPLVAPLACRSHRRWYRQNAIGCASHRRPALAFGRWHRIYKWCTRIISTQPRRGTPSETEVALPPGGVVTVACGMPPARGV
jgi:hypothetical protein